MTVRPLLAVAAVAGALAGCSETQSERLPLTDRLYFPVGVATTRLPGGSTAVLVSSSNFDLRYAAVDGGTLASVDPLASDGAGTLALLGGAVRIGSYGGPVAMADDATCPVLPSRPRLVLTASRYDDAVYQLAMDDAGALSCGDGCVRPGPAALKDPWAVAVACGGGRRRGFVSYLNPPYLGAAAGYSGWISEWDLDSPGGAGRDVELGDGPIHGLAWDPVADRLWATSLSAGARTLLYAVRLADARWDGAAPRDAVEVLDLFSQARGTELRAVAVGTPPAAGITRLFLTAVLYDADAQASSGQRGGATGGALLVVDVTEDATTGRLVPTLRAALPIGLGAADVRLVRRAGGQPDLAVVTATDEDLVLLYDDATGGVAWAVAHDAAGAPVMGDRPVGVAVDQVNPGDVADVYVAGFGSHLVTRFPVDPSNPAVAPTLHRIGGLAP